MATNAAEATGPGPAMLGTLLADALGGRPVDVALVLGSGLAPLVQRLQVRASFPYTHVPGLAAATVEDHRGYLTVGDWAGKRLLVFEGRLHYYEGHSWSQVEMNAQIAAELGARQLVLTNASGGIRADLLPGSLMAIRAQIEWNRPYCWRGPARPSPYSPRLLQLLKQAAQAAGVRLFEGIYAAVTGPSYETPAEIRALRACGADAVGMSTTREALRGHALGLEVAAVSCVTNRAAGLGGGPLTHEEVLATAAAHGEQLAELVEACLRFL
jgi:purine-nucleoside phosphorylase